MEDPTHNKTTPNKQSKPKPRFPIVFKLTILEINRFKKFSWAEIREQYLKVLSADVVTELIGATDVGFELNYCRNRKKPGPT